MQRGGEKTPTALRLLRGRTSHEALPKGEIKPKRFDRVPEPPKRLGAYAREEWIRLAPELHRLGVLTQADMWPFACYCQAYERWCEIDDALITAKADDVRFNAQVVANRFGDMVINPLVRAQREAALDLIRFANEFGFTPASRTRVSGTAATDEPQSKFDGLLAHQA